MTPFVKLITKILGIVLVLVGIAGFFVPNGMLLVFEVDATHNIVHLLSGIVALAVAGNYAYARLYLLVFGLVYGLVTVVGFAMNGDILGLFRANMEDNYLHALIAVVCLGTALGSKKSV